MTYYGFVVTFHEWQTRQHIINKSDVKNSIECQRVINKNKQIDLKMTSNCFILVAEESSQPNL